MKVISLLFNIFTHLRLVFVASFCLVTLCSCGLDRQPPVSSIPTPPVRTPIPDPPVRTVEAAPSAQEEDIDQETERRIRQDFWDLTHRDIPDTDRSLRVDDVVIKAYYGNYNGSIPVIIGYNSDDVDEDKYPMYQGGSKRSVEVTTVVANVAFRSSMDISIFIWKEGRFYLLREAYNFGLLTVEDLRKIADLHNKIFDELREE